MATNNLIDLEEADDQLVDLDPIFPTHQPDHSISEVSSTPTFQTFFADNDHHHDDELDAAHDVEELMETLGNSLLSPDPVLKRKSISSFTEAARLSTPNFDMSQNLTDNDHREIDTEQVEELMKTLGCSFDEARLSLVKRQMKEAGIDPDTGLPIETNPRTADADSRARENWNHLLTATRPPNPSHVSDGWNQLEVCMTVKGVDISDLCLAMQAEKAKEQANKARLRYAFAKLSSKLTSSPDSTSFETARCWIEIHQGKTTRVIAVGDGEALEDPNQSEFELVLTTEPQPIAENVNFVVAAMLTLPPLPAYVDILFQFVTEFNSQTKVIGKATCKSSELFTMATHALMLESTVTNAVDSILCLESNPSRQHYKPHIFPTARWLSQSYRCDKEMETQSIIHEELCETSLAFEVPAKFLKLRGDEMIDEHARLEGKVGEVEVIMSDFTSYFTHQTSQFAQHATLEGDLVVLDVAHEQDRVRRQQQVAHVALQDLVQRAGAQIRNYRTLCKYYRDCLEDGRKTKYSSHKTEGALRAVPTNLHLHTLTVIPLTANASSRNYTTPLETDIITKATDTITNTDNTTSDTAPTPPPPPFNTHCTVTSGAPAAAALGFGCGGLQSMYDSITHLGLKLGCDHLITTPCIHWSAAYSIRTIHGISVNEADPWSNVHSEATLAKLIFDFRIRLDAVLGQALSLLTTAFMSKLEEAYRLNKPATLARYVSAGFLCSFESLLSTMGSEQKMLRDVRMAVTVIKQAFEFRLVRKSAEQSNDDTISISKNKKLTGYFIDVALDDTVYAWLPPSCKADGNAICALPVLFTQGVNEWQKLSNLVGTNSLQATINNASLQLLQHYSGKCTNEERACGTVSRTTQLACQHIMELTNPSHHKKQDHEMLWMAADSCRMLGGGRVTFCKSGKDRTAQAVTLESTRLLCRHDGLRSSWELWLANLMRINGVRRSNVFYNTGQFLYAFNSLQVRTLPPPYRPPPNTHK